jgi:hypothetical protein
MVILPAVHPARPPPPPPPPPQFLRPHQREGVQFMFECVTGLRSFAGQGGRGGRGRLRQRAWRINKGQPRPPCSRLDSNLSL